MARMNAGPEGGRAALFCDRFSTAVVRAEQVG